MGWSVADVSFRKAFFLALSLHLLSILLFLSVLLFKSFYLPEDKIDITVGVVSASELGEIKPLDEIFPNNNREQLPILMPVASQVPNASSVQEPIALESNPSSNQNSTPQFEIKNFNTNENIITREVIESNFLEQIEKAKAVVRKNSSYDDAESLTPAEAQAIQGQFKQCWFAQAGSPNPKDLMVRLRLEMNRDATVRRIIVVNDNGRSRTDPFFRVAVERAVQSFDTQECRQLQLPLGEYNRWSVIYMDFNPSNL